MVINNQTMSTFKVNKKEDRRTNYETLYYQAINHLQLIIISFIDFKQ